MARKTVTSKHAQKRLDEIDGELRAQLSPIQVALRLREAKVCYEALHPETRASRETGGGKKRTGEKAFVTERVDRTGKSESWIRQHLRIADIPKDLLEPLDASSIRGEWTNLYDLARQEPQERLREIAGLVIENPTLSYKDAVAQVAEQPWENPVPLPPLVSDRWRLLQNSWEKVPPDEIQAGTVDAVISDIDWSKESVLNMDAFVAFCDHIVRPRGHVILMVGQAMAFDVERAFRKDKDEKKRPRRFNVMWTMACETGSRSSTGIN